MGALLGRAIGAIVVLFKLQGLLTDAATVVLTYL